MVIILASILALFGLGFSFFRIMGGVKGGLSNALSFFVPTSGVGIGLYVFLGALACWFGFRRKRKSLMGAIALLVLSFGVSATIEKSFLAAKDQFSHTQTGKKLSKNQELLLHGDPTAKDPKTYDIIVSHSGHSNWFWALFERAGEFTGSGKWYSHTEREKIIEIKSCKRRKKKIALKKLPKGEKIDHPPIIYEAIENQIVK